MTNYINLQLVNILDDSIRYEYEYSRSIKHIFNNNYFSIGHDESLDQVPEAIAVAPFVLRVMPIAWAQDIKVTVPTVDASIIDSLRELRVVLNKLYPQIGFNDSNNNLVVENIEKNIDKAESTGTQPATLFSGGVDGYASYFNHRDESPALLFVEYKSEDYDSHTEFKTLKNNVEYFADRENVRFHSINSKFRELINTKGISPLYYDKLSNYSWWQKIQHVLFYVSCCIPLCYQMEYRKLYVPSTFTKDFDMNWGSFPDIVNTIHWRLGEASHDMFDFTRQKKWHLILNEIDVSDHGYIIQSCEPLPCNECFDCARNIMGMYVEGVDPTNYGYNISDETFKNIQRSIITGEWEMEPVNRFYWEDIQRSANENKTQFLESCPAGPDFKEWFLDLNLEDYAIEKQKKSISRKHEFYNWLLKRNPLVATTVKDGYLKIKGEND